MLSKPWVRNCLIIGIALIALTLMLSMKKVLGPLFIALTIAYVCDPMVDWLETKKVSRVWGIVILILIALLALTGLLLYLVPKLIHEINLLFKQGPELWNEFYTKFVVPNTSYILDDSGQILYLDKVTAWFEDNAGMLAQKVGNALLASIKSVGTMVGSLLSLIIIPVLAFYLLRDFDIMVGKARRLIPIKKRELVEGLVLELHIVLGNFIKGQLLVAVILSIIYSVGLLIAGCPAALLIGILAGFANLIPYLGIALGFVPGVLLTYLSGNPIWQVVTAGLTFVVGQMLEGMVITPKVVGDSVGLHPVVVMVGLMIGGSYFGFMGMVLALPVTAIAMVLLRRTYNLYTDSILYHENDPEHQKGKKPRAKNKK